MAMQELRNQIKNSETRTERAAQISNYAYREVPGLESERLDVIEQFRANMAQLEDLHGRLRFVMSEVRSLIVR
ncbi:MAG: hypothetical protein AB7N80_14665 [Bdellovibrionales bacterium]